MLFDNEMNERLLAFARNIAALLFIGGFALLITYRADTLTHLQTYEYIALFCCGIIMLLWSMYLALSNVTILYDDFREYLKRCMKKENIQYSLTEKQLKSTSHIIKVLIQDNWLNAVLYYFRAATIFLICFAFTLIYLIGMVSILTQQAKIFGF